jgi:hypothetical protein
MQVMVLTPDVDRQKVNDGKPSKQLAHKVAQEASLLKEMRKAVVARYAYSPCVRVCACVCLCVCMAIGAQGSTRDFTL